MKEISIAVVGATGTVGEAMISLLSEMKLPIKQLFPLASSRSKGSTVLFGSKPLMVEDLSEFDFKTVDVALFSAGGSVSKEFAPIAAEAGCVVIDNTSHFRLDDDIPLVVSEVNPEDIANYTKRNIIANPNCSTMQLMVALKPIHDAVGIARVNVATYQAVSGAGRKAIEELAKQTAELLSGKGAEPKVFPAQIAFNVLPQIDKFLENGYTKEEMKLINESKKILHDDDMLVNATCVRIPVFYGHCEAVNIETRKPISAADARTLLEAAPGIELADSDEDYPTPLSTAGDDPVYVGRLRQDISHPNGLNMWVVADNIRKGAALNSVEILKILIEKYL